MSTENEKPPMLHVTGLWKKTDRNGRTFHVGTLGGLRIFIFENHEKKTENSPDLLLSIGQRFIEHGGSQGGGNNGNQESNTS